MEASSFLASSQPDNAKIPLNYLERIHDILTKFPRNQFRSLQDKSTQRSGKSLIKLHWSIVISLIYAHKYIKNDSKTHGNISFKTNLIIFIFDQRSQSCFLKTVVLHCRFMKTTIRDPGSPFAEISHPQSVWVTKLLEDSMANSCQRLLSSENSRPRSQLKV